MCAYCRPASPGRPVEIIFLTGNRNWETYLISLTFEPIRPVSTPCGIRPADHGLPRSDGLAPVVSDHWLRSGSTASSVRSHADPRAPRVRYQVYRPSGGRRHDQGRLGRSALAARPGRVFARAACRPACSQPGLDRALSSQPGLKANLVVVEVITPEAGVDNPGRLQVLRGDRHLLGNVRRHQLQGLRYRRWI